MKENTLLVFFDTINHKILISKLEHYGIRGICQKWFENYLSDRKQIVKYNITKSDTMTMTSGVPQGSILGPLLFLLYINDIQNCSNLTSIILFADDTSIFHSHKCLKTLNKTIQSELNKISNWLIVNKLSINTLKTKFMVFRSSKKKQNYNVTISINDKKIEQVKKTTFLGVIIDEYLTWNDHLSLIHNKLLKSAAIISKSRHYLNIKARKLLYYALVYPYLIYSNIIWGSTYKKIILRLINIQKKVIRIMTFKSYSEHTEQIFRDLEILNIEEINDYLTSIFMFRYHHLGNLPKIFKNYFTPIIMKFMVTIQEVHLNFTKLLKEQIMQNRLLLIKELTFGIIWIMNIKILNLIMFSRRELRNTYQIRSKLTVM